MIKVKNLNKSFNYPVLKNVNLTLECGNIYVLKGISGSGKTTLLNIISGLDKSYEGECLVNNKDIKNMNPHEFSNYQGNIGYIMQQSLLFKKLTILDNLKLIENNEEKIIKFAKEFNVDNILDKYPYQISGGERQRIALIRAMLNDRKIIIADEPTSSLDIDHSSIFVQYLKKINIKDKIIIIATHKDIYDDIATQILDIDFGQITFRTRKKPIQGKLDLSSKPNKLYSKFILQNKKSFGLIFNIILIAFMATILLVTSIKLKYQDEYIKLYLKDNPGDVIETDSFLTTNISEIIEYTYEDYIIQENNYKVYTLLKEEDSIFQDKHITYGSFPKKGEVLVNEEWARLIYPDTSLESIVGLTAKIQEKEYLISGVIAYKPIFDIYRGFYLELNNYPYSKPAVFLDYNLTKTIGIKKSEQILIKIKKEYLKDIYTTDKYQREFSASIMYGSYKYDIYKLINNTQHISNIAIIIVIVISFLLILFLTNQISLELFFKRKEIGYLQIFNFSKSQIKSIYLSEYILNILINFIIAIILYIIVIGILYIKTKCNYLINPFIIILLLIILLLYSLIIVYIPLKKILKENIVNLIKQ